MGNPSNLGKPNRLTPEHRMILIERAQMVLRNMRECNSGADVHEVGSIRNIASLLIQQLMFQHDVDFITSAEKMVHRLEDRCVRFFQKKYS